MADKKKKRMEALRAAAGIAAPSTAAGAASATAAAGFDMRARIVEAEQAAEAQKEVARQQTHQAAIKENSEILHELDGKIFELDYDLGTKRKPAPARLRVSLLGAYGLANLAICLQQDMAALAAGVNPTEIGIAWADARTPRTDKWQYHTAALLPDQAATVAAATTAAAGTAGSEYNTDAAWTARYVAANGHYPSGLEKLAARAQGWP